MPLSADVAQVFRDYPRIYFACHREHVRDPKTGVDVSARQVSILDHLDANHPTMLSDLAKHLGVTPATMSLAIGRLVDRGYVTRVLDPVDRRKVQLRLTATAFASRTPTRCSRPTLVEDMLDQLSTTDRRAALHGLELLARAAGAAQKARTQATKRTSQTQQLTADPSRARDDTPMKCPHHPRVSIALGHRDHRDRRRRCCRATTSRRSRRESPRRPRPFGPLITDPAKFPAWRGDVTKVDLLPPAPHGSVVARALASRRDHDGGRPRRTAAQDDRANRRRRACPTAASGSTRSRPTATRRAASPSPRRARSTIRSSASFRDSSWGTPRRSTHISARSAAISGPSRRRRVLAGGRHGV